jgi:3-hydroxyisobutyrate dehydrogenase
MPRSTAARGIRFLDAPVSGGTTGAKAATLSIMVGGESDTFERAQPVLNGSGSIVKLINQLMVGIHTQAVSEGLALGRQAGVEEEKLVKILSTSLASSRVLEHHYENHISQENFEAGFAIKLLGKDLDLVAEFAEEVGMKLAIGGHVKGLLRSAIKSGYEGKDMSAMLEYQLHRNEQTAAVKHFAVFLPMKDAELSVTFREQHLQFLSDRRAEGKLLANGRFTDGTGGLVIYKGQSQAEVEACVNQDPYIIEGARSYVIHEWDIVLADPS